MEEMSHEYDVIVVGAGFAGLSAAYHLLKQRPATRICVLEAKGEETTYNWEFGGMWVGRPQEDVMNLLAELEIGTYDQKMEGRKCLKLDGDTSVRTYASSIPSLGLLSTLDIGQALYRLERLVKTVPADDPWKCPDAANLDAMTAEALLKKYAVTSHTIQMLKAASRTIWGAELAEMSALYFLSYCSAAGSFNALTESAPGSAQEWKIQGGSQNVCIQLVEKHIKWENVKLSHPVSQVQQTDEHVLVHIDGSDTVLKSKYVIMTCPPHQTLKIDFSPALSAERRQLYKHMPVGHLIKVIVTYKKAWWTEGGFSGEVLTTDYKPDSATGCVSICFDATSEQGHPAIVAFIGGDQAVAWGQVKMEERKASVLATLADMFSCDEMLSPLDYGEKDWSLEPYSGGCPVNIITTGVMRYYGPSITSTLDRLEFAGTELSPVWCGLMSGAVYSGRRAADSILQRL